MAKKDEDRIALDLSVTGPTLTPSPRFLDGGRIAEEFQGIVQRYIETHYTPYEPSINKTDLYST